MRSNDRIMELDAEEIKYNIVNIALYILMISTTLYLSYRLLYWIGHIQMTSNYTTIEVEGEEIKYKNEMSNSIYFAFILHYITLTNYYIAQDKLRW